MCTEEIVEGFRNASLVLARRRILREEDASDGEVDVCYSRYYIRDDLWHCTELF